MATDQTKSIDNAIFVSQSVDEMPRIVRGKIQKMGMLDNSVKQCGSDFSVGEYFVPFCEFYIRGDDEGFAFVALRNDVKKQFRAVRIYRNISPFVANQQVELVELFHEFRKPTFAFCLSEGVYESRRSPESGAETGVASGDSLCNLVIGFARSALSHMIKLFRILGRIRLFEFIKLN